MTKIKSLAVAVFFSFITLSSQAAVLIEPILGYNLDGVLRVEDDVTGQTKTGGGGSGAAYGGRLGYQKLGFQIGVDYLNSKMKFKSEEPIVSSEWGAFVGFEFPILLRAYAGYIFSASAEAENIDTGNGGTADANYSGGTGAKVGIGFTLLPFVDLNLEYRRTQYDELKVGSLPKSSDERTFSTFMVGVSLPLTF